MAFCISKNTRAHVLTRKVLVYIFLCDCDFKNHQNERIRTPDVHQMAVRNDTYILIGGYSEMLFSETRDYPCEYVNRKRTKYAIHIFNMVDISVNPNREWNF